ncbi:MAG: (deoxy)nucleoside triphosphate pyrophosphohydrolase [Burkholderiales bacterium]|nr:MAG: (deoxy)nucleoside triphosphate pyrophosphohydrolase [Burkholderiales bacterium]TAG81729.1 MAG: (deoxy)nucleoside triphosphate pyrophosphohydrolase [Betaproteobacteria bacterium]
MNASFDPSDSRALTRVAVVIIERIVNDRYEVLFAQRPAGKAYAGYWEFPGGKIEANESLQDASIREIEEELGIQIASVHPLTTERFSYPHAHVELCFVTTRDWQGEPQSREGQAFSWQDPTDIQLQPLLPALLNESSTVLRGVRARALQET